MVAISELCGAIGATKGNSHTSEYKTWRQMILRCFDPCSPSYRLYGAVGIRVCDRWLVYDAFLEDMGKKPNEKLSLDRIDRSKDYCKENCRWADWNTQARNRPQCVRVIYNDRVMVLKDACLEAGLSYDPTRKRIKAFGVLKGSRGIFRSVVDSSS